MKSAVPKEKESDPSQIARKDSNFHMQPALSFLDLEVNYDHLKSYLEQLTGVMNQHAAVIVKVQEEVDRKSYSKSVSDSLGNIAENCSIFDNELLKIVQAQVQKPKPEKTSTEIEGNSNKKMKDHESLLKKHEEQIPKLNEKEIAKKKSKKFKKKIEDEVTDLKALIDKKVNEADKKLSTQIANFEEGLRQTERKTLWKIEDCQTLLTKRTNNEYVDTVALNLEEKLMKEITNLKDGGAFGGLEALQRVNEELNDKIRGLDNDFAEKLKGLRKNFTDLNDKISLKAVPLEKFEDTKKMLFDKFSDLLIRMRDFEQKADPSALFETHIQAIKNINSKIAELERSLVN